MIKFNFNGNIDIKSNGTKIDKKAFKTILIVFAVFIFVCISSIIGFGAFIYRSLDSMEQAVEAHNNQLDNIADLPVLKCKIYTDQTITSPMSGTESSLYLLRIGVVNFSTHMNSKRPSKIFEEFDYSAIAGFPKGTQLSINNQLYPVDFKLCIADNINGAVHFTKDTYATNHETSYYLRNYHTTENHKISLLKGQHPWVNSFLEPYGLTNLLVKEYVFKKGDSIFIKGKIENERIVPFVEHMVN
ncbi:hypothetical protein [Chryseobacterium sp. KCF3-3]|uniref:hypothetical protein n=1 Tax=Chryseobacterium sp. KCF3-3 TaxID=3231511 RepID=UPI0038B2652B